jgi:hypothetical protein
MIATVTVDLASYQRETKRVAELEAMLGEKRVTVNTLERVLMVAQVSLRDAHEAAVLNGVNVHWDVLEPALREAHDLVTTTLST